MALKNYALIFKDMSVVQSEMTKQRKQKNLDRIDNSQPKEDLRLQ